MILATWTFSVPCEPPELKKLHTDIPRIATFLFKRAFLNYSAKVQKENWTADVSNTQWQANCTTMEEEISSFVCVVAAKCVSIKVFPSVSLA